jgi:hypothetical protein
LYGQGSSGAAGSAQCSTAGERGGGGSGGCGGGNTKCGGNYGGGAGGTELPYPAGSGGNGASGAVRIVWPGQTRSFPSTSVGSP